MTTATHNYGWLMPDPGASANTWGSTLNGATQAIDAKMWSINAQVTVNTLSVSRGPDGGAYGQILFQNNGGVQMRWQLGETSEPETGGNAGSNFLLNAFNDTGAYLGQAFEVIRGTQTVAFAKAVTVGAALTVNGAAAVGTTLAVGSAASVGTTLAVGGNIASNSGYQCKAGSSGGFNGNAFNIEWTGSVAHLWIDNVNQGAIVMDNGSQTTISGNLITGGNITVNGTLTAGTVNPGAGGVNTTGNVKANGYAGRQGTAGAYSGNIMNTEWGGTYVQGWVNNVMVGNFAYVSDYRIKKDVTALPSMWDRVKAIKPISYTHQDYTPSGSVPKEGKTEVQPLVIGNDVEHWGFVAHELQETLIESAATGVKDQDDCLQSPNPWTVIATLTRALQEAMMRIEALEAAGDTVVH